MKQFTKSVLFGCSLLLANQAWSGPLVNIQPGGWQEAMDAGLVTSASGESLTGAAEQFYSGANQVGDPQIRPTQLTADISTQDSDGTSFDALVMAWEGLDTNLLTVGAWDLNLGVLDPDVAAYDLSRGSAAIHFSLFAPPDIWDVSVELIDSNGGSRGFFLSMPPTDPMGDPLWLECWLPINSSGPVPGACMDAVTMAPALPSTFQVFDVGFDPTSVVAIRFDEAGMTSQSFPLPGGATAPSGATGPIFWNAWNHVFIEASEPALTAVMGLGMLMVIAGRRRSRSRG